MNRHVNGFIKGVGVLVVLVLLIFAGIYAKPGLADMLTNANNNGDGGSSTSSNGLTDNPGSQVGYVASPGPVGLNNGNHVNGGNQLEGATDDPLGRTVIPLAQTEAVNNNIVTLDGSMVNDGGIEGAGVEVTNNVLVVPSADFRSDGVVPQGPFFWFGGGYWTGYTGSTCLEAPVYVPGGASIYQLWATVYDNDASNQIWITLFRVDNYAGAVDILGSLASGVANASTAWTQLSDIAIDFPVVEYPTYSYYMGTCMTSTSLRLLSTRVWYTQ